VFHVGLLKKFVGTPPDAPPPLPVNHHGVVLEPERAMHTRLVRGVRQVLVQWKGEPTASATWKDIDSFIERHLDFQLEEELHVEGERCYVGKAA
jgi:hypothetical protein